MRRSKGASTAAAQHACSADFVITLAIKTIGSGKATKIGHGFELPDEDIGCHARLTDAAMRCRNAQLSEVFHCNSQLAIAPSSS